MQCATVGAGADINTLSACYLCGDEGTCKSKASLEGAPSPMQFAYDDFAVMWLAKSRMG